MKPAKKKRGRPRKQAGEVKFKDFIRAGIVISVYDELRRKNEKQSVAVREVVEVLTCQSQLKCHEIFVTHRRPPPSFYIGGLNDNEHNVP
jgi:hypothetical protein